MPRSSVHPGGAARQGCDALGVQDEIVEPRAKLEYDVGLFGDRGGKRRLQVAAMHDPVGRAVAEFHVRAERQYTISRPDFAVRIDSPSGTDDLGRRAVGDAERDQDAGGVRGELDAGADVGEPVALVRPSARGSRRARASRRRSVRRSRRPRSGWFGRTPMTMLFGWRVGYGVAARPTPVPPAPDPAGAIRGGRAWGRSDRASSNIRR